MLLQNAKEGLGSINHEFNGKRQFNRQNNKGRVHNTFNKKMK